MPSEATHPCHYSDFWLGINENSFGIVDPFLMIIDPSEWRFARNEWLSHFCLKMKNALIAPVLALRHISTTYFWDVTTIFGLDRTTQLASHPFELNQCRATAAALFLLIGLSSGCSADGDFEDESKTRSISRLVDSGFHRYDPTRPHLSIATT